MKQDAKEIERLRETALALLRRHGRQIPIWNATEADVGPFRLLLGRVNAETEVLDVMYGPDTVATWELRTDGPPALTHFDPGPWCDALLTLDRDGDAEPLVPLLD